MMTTFLLSLLDGATPAQMGTTVPGSQVYADQIQSRNIWRGTLKNDSDISKTKRLLECSGQVPVQ